MTTDDQTAAQQSGEQLEVTHFQRRSPEANRWVKVVFLTRPVNSTSEQRYVGFEKGEVLESADPSKHVLLNPPRPINHDQRLWLNSDDEIWLATEQDPVSDPNRILLYEGKRRLLDNASIPRAL